LDENSGRKIISGAKFVKKYKIFGYIRCPYIKEKFMNFQQLSTFCKVVAERSMTAAAQKLYLTQPAVSQQIRALEEDLNVELFVKFGEKGAAARLEPTSLEYWIATTDPEDLKAETETREKNPSLKPLALLQLLANQFPKGKRTSEDQNQ
jgi:hypothetical protein